VALGLVDDGPTQFGVFVVPDVKLRDDAANILGCCSVSLSDLLRRFPCIFCGWFERGVLLACRGFHSGDFVDTDNVFGMLIPVAKVANELGQCRLLELAVTSVCFLLKALFLARQALLLDPLTSSILSPEQTFKMADEMFEAQQRWLEYLS